MLLRHMDRMSTMTKWIGGTTAIVLLAFGGASVASTLFGGKDATYAAPADAAADAANVISLKDAIPVDEDVIANANGADTNAMSVGAGTALSDGDTESLADPAMQDISAKKSAAKPKDEAFVIKRILPITGPIKYGEWHWDDKDVPAGPLVMTVDLQARVISVFRGGYEIGASAVLLGTDKHPTPLGTFPIRYKMRHNVSEKYNNAPMPYSMFLTTDGVALHGSQVENGYASHGCVGMPDEFAAKVFAIAKKGDKVIITDGKRIGVGDSII